MITMTSKPPALQKGDTVSIISPSSLITNDLKKQFDVGIKTLQDFGLEVKIGPHVFDKYYYSAGKREDRISDINSMWEDDNVAMILMSLGGGSALQLVNGLDYKNFKDHPKIISGISDGTILLNAIYAKSKIVTYHGPDLLFTFGLPISQLFKENIEKTFFTGNVGQLKPNPNWKCDSDPRAIYFGWNWIKEGNATGILVGGNITCLSNLLLSGYGPDMTNKILFLEGYKPVNSLDREFFSLYLSGVFEKIKGLIIGWFDNVHMKDPTQDRPISDLIKEFTKDYDFPILEIGELGHNVENYVLPIGCQATIDSFKNEFSIDEPTVNKH